MDPAYLRRFSMCLEVEVPPKKVREKIILEKSEGLLSIAVVKSLAERDDIAPDIVENLRALLKRSSRLKRVTLTQFLLSISIRL